MKRGWALERQRDGLEEEDRQGQVANPFSPALLMAAPHRFELGDVRLVVLGDVRDHRPGERQMLRAAPPDPAERLSLDRAPLLEARQRRQVDRRGQGPRRLGGSAGGGRPRGARGRVRLRGGRRRSMAARRAAHVLVRDPTAGAGAADSREVHAQLAREPTGRRGRRRSDAGRGGLGRRRCGWCGRGRPSGRRGGRSRGLAPLSGVAEAQEDRADLDALAGLDVDGRHASAERRGQLDLRLLGLHQEDGLVLLDLVALRDEHADDLRLGETFPEIGQPELFRHRGRNAARAGAAA